MNSGFWAKLPKPFFMLAPMANVTDAAFRQLIAKYGKPDVFYTEFVSADGLMSVGRDNIIIDLKYSASEHPIVAQVFTSKPENMFKVAKMIKDMGFDGIDINMGCPDRNVEKQGCGSSLIKNPKLAQELIYAAKEGAKEIPVSVKTRAGYNKVEIDNWIPSLLDTKPACIILHARTRKEMSKVPARWSLVKETVDIAKGTGVLIAGNGDVVDLEDGRQKALETGCDGIMVGRGIFGNPWLFSGRVEVSITERLQVMVEHAELFDKILGQHKNFALLKKHYKAYTNGFKGAKNLRIKLMETNNVSEIVDTVRNFQAQINA
jgi:nifR3 family TIM-barrel protein